MSKKGGYIIIDFGEKSLSTTAVTIDGIYERIEGNFKKPILASGLVYGVTEYPDTFVQVTVSSGNFVFTAYGKVVTITDDDEITIANA